MADITYTVNQDNPENIAGFEQFSQADTQLVNKFEVNNLFIRDKNYIEFHILDLVDTLLESNYNYSSYKELGNAQSAGKEGASVLTINPVQDIEKSGYSTGDVKVLYHFLNDLFTLSNQQVNFFIQEISPDRTEVKLQSLELTNEQIVEFTQEIKNKLTTQSFFSEFRLNFKNNNLIIGVNIDTLIEDSNNVVVVKLYEPLPIEFEVKNTLNIVETVADSVAYIVDSSIDFIPEIQPTLRPANFNLELTDTETVPTGYLSYDELFSYPVNNSNNQIYSLLNEKGVELSINHTNFSNFIHFSSAYERLLNFKYKLELIESYTLNLSEIGNIPVQSISTTGSAYYYENLIEGIVSNFDHYERFLYYESSSYSWPKSNTTKPYVNILSSNPIAIDWYTDQLAIANNYDLTNLNAIVNSVPVFLREDPNNANYITFIHMIGQHFDNLWIYGKGVSDKYDADNRLDFGVSKDLVAEVLKNFGVKVYTSNKSIEDLFSSFIGQGYVSGSEVVNNYITGSVTGSNTPIQPSSFDNYQREIYKRIYHNLPLLLKSKGTERGLRALINCFGIPSDTLDIKLYGGRNTNERPFYGDYRYYTSSLDKVRLDNTGSIIEGNTISQYTSTVKRDNKYTDDLHAIEVGFSPTDNIDKYIISKSLADTNLTTFNIDQYIGDPRNLTLPDYEGLYAVAEDILGDLTQYDVRDFVRLIKFFDNVIFKMVKDFIPARSVADTGIIIKPHLLNRSKAKSVITTVTEKENLFTASIDTAFIAGTHGNTFGSTNQYNTEYIETIQTPFGLGTTSYHNQQEAKYDGELSGSQLTVTDGHLTQDNIYTVPSFVESTDNLLYISASTATCALGNNNDYTLVYETEGPYQVSHFFTNAQAVGMIYTINPGDTTITFPYTFSESQFDQYGTFTVTAVDTNVGSCTATVNLMYGKCDIEENLFNGVPNYSQLIKIEDYPFPVNLLDTYFIIGNNHNLDTLTVTISKNGTQIDVITGVEAQIFLWDNPDYGFDSNDTVTIIVTDGLLTPYSNGITCTATATITVADCTIDPLMNMTIGLNNGVNNQDSILIGTIGRYEKTNLPHTIIKGARNADPNGGDFDPPNPGKSPIHHTEYTYPDDQTYDMTIKFPYLTNPNYIFENPDGTPRQSLPITSSELGIQSDLSGYQLGLASFFEGLGNLNDISYEVYIYDVINPFPTPYGDPTVHSLRFVASDWNEELNFPFIGGGENENDLGSYSGIRTGAIKPGQTSATDTNFPYGTENGIPYWTYNTPAPNSNQNPVAGYVAELNIPLLVQELEFGTKVWRTTGEQYDTGYAQLVRIYAYSPSPYDDGYTCVDSIDITVEAWIRVLATGGTTGGGR